MPSKRQLKHEHTGICNFKCQRHLQSHRKGKEAVFSSPLGLQMQSVFMYQNMHSWIQ